MPRRNRPRRRGGQRTPEAAAVPDLTPEAAARLLVSRGLRTIVILDRPNLYFRDSRKDVA